MADITVEQASEALGQDVKTITDWVNEGLLPGKRKGRSILLETEDILEVRTILDNGKRIKKPIEHMALLELRIRRLERLVTALCKICQVPQTVTLSHLDDKELYKIYTEAFDSIMKDSWGDIEIRKWAAIFIQITEVDLDRIAIIVGTSRPWGIFMALCNKIIGWWELGTGESKDPTIMELTYLLDKSRKNLRNASILHHKESNRSPLRLLERYFDLPPDEKLIRFASSIRRV
jgi:hypothetical protein